MQMNMMMARGNSLLDELTNEVECSFGNALARGEADAEADEEGEADDEGGEDAEVRRMEEDDIDESAELNSRLARVETLMLEDD